ncbi:MAG: Fe-S protein assembly co-chaperone HscB [Acidobacteria bacterium RIFCSPHIGHO2_02_FULL_67_57]|nr:MAG: Fe-S protein assembly co-chaperone HscB [Acidobacteria bacterium RIFCSPHIGHO2_01_FULL_67_28]OFV86494.1 MAG: Fe-S protein assembly co-chaperone HscB [Acidobacteria bacterium RIFCSPHIGHO2_02_FULL_67_57]
MQPLGGEADYFSFFRLPRRLGLDPAQLEKQFHDLSWKLHPDRFHQAGDYERSLSLERTAVLNDAYRTLRDPVSRVEYLLRLEGVRKDGEVKQQAPADLLEEVFELNEYLEELRAAKSAGGDARALDDLRHRLEKTRAAFQEKLDAVLAELTAQFSAWDERGDRAALVRLSEILNRHSYIRNLVRNVTEELES